MLECSHSFGVGLSSMEVPAKSSVRFAGFVLDLGLENCARTAEKTYLQEKPFQILTLLLQRPGELVTRDQLVKRCGRMEPSLTSIRV